MKKTVLTFGLISGAMLTAFMFAALPFADRIGFDRAEIVGYTAMVLSFLLVFFGIRSYRENVGDGYITFWKSLQVGLLIVLVASICYVISWQILYRNFLPDFIDQYIAHEIETLRSSGASAETIASKTQEFETFKEYYKIPIVNIAFTFLEPTVVGIPMTLLSAALLRKRRKQGLDAPAPLEQPAA